MAFLEPEAAIIKRLTEKLVELQQPPKILTAADAAKIEERSQFAPAIYVLFDGYAPTDDVSNGAVQRIEQSWLIYVLVKNAAGQITGEGVRKEAAVLIDFVLKALCGFKPHQDFETFRLTNGPGPSFQEGFGYFPLLFKTRTVVRGAP